MDDSKRAGDASSPDGRPQLCEYQNSFGRCGLPSDHQGKHEREGSQPALSRPPETPEETTDQRIAEIRAREQNATPGPWTRKDDPEVNDQPRVAGPVKANGKRNVIATFPFGFPSGIVAGNADFIAHAREDIPYLLDALTVLQQRIERAEAAGMKESDFWESKAHAAEARVEQQERSATEKANQALRLLSENALLKGRVEQLEQAAAKGRAE